VTVPSCDPASSATRVKLRGVGSAAVVTLGTTLCDRGVAGELVTTIEVGVVVWPAGTCETEHAVSKMTTTSARKAS
jgi:hypothetical protein